MGVEQPMGVRPQPMGVSRWGSADGGQTRFAALSTDGAGADAKTRTWSDPPAGPHRDPGLSLGTGSASGLPGPEGFTDLSDRGRSVSRSGSDGGATGRRRWIGTVRARRQRGPGTLIFVMSHCS